MACKEDRFPLGDRVYFIRQMPPRLAFKVEVFLAKTIGQPLFKAFATDELSGTGAIAVAIGLFAERLDEEEILKVIHSTFRYVGIDGVCVRIIEEADKACAGLDTHFMGRNRELLQVLGQALKVNFADFFDGLPSLSTLLSKLRGQVSSASQTSTHGSSDPSSQTQSSAQTSAP